MPPMAPTSTTQVAVSGGSYGGRESWLQAAQQAGRSTWTNFPGLPKLHLQVAVPKYPWTDLAYSLAPNGHPGTTGGRQPAHADGDQADPASQGKLRDDRAVTD
jgi:hypothetical protein